MNIWQLVLVTPLVNGLLVFYHIFGNLGVSIIVLTAAIRILLMPITLPSMRAMQKMKLLSPELEKLKKRHKEDKTKLMQAQADLYKTHGVNPASGCLPQIVQLVVLFALVGVFGLLNKPNPTESINFFAYPALHLNSPINTHFLYFDLTKPDVFKVNGLPFALPGLLLIFSAVSQFVSALIMMPQVNKLEKVATKTPGQADDFAASFQKQSLYMFPVLTLFFGLNFASGLVLYWTIQSIATAAQQYYISGWGGLTPWLSRFNLVK